MHEQNRSILLRTKYKIVVGRDITKHFLTLVTSQYHIVYP
jgi:hypothetical protein